jgi:hypothetical protein
MKKAQKQYYKKVAKYKSNRNWQSSRRNDIEAVNQLFGGNKLEIKQKMLEALGLLRQADHALDKVCEYLTILPRTCEPLGPLIPRKSVCVCVYVLTTGSEGLPYYAVPTARLIHPPQCL